MAEYLNEVLDEDTLKDLNKKKLVEIIFAQRNQTSELQTKLESVGDDISTLKSDISDKSNKGVLGDIADFKRRIIELERKLYAQEQYTRRECVEIVGIKKEVSDNNLSNVVVEAFKCAGVDVTPRSFQAIHKLRNKETVIAKLVHRADAIDILRKKRVLRELDDEKKVELSLQGKVYVNESLCPAYNIILGKCNALYKSRHISAFYTINGKILITIGGTRDVNGRITNPLETLHITHVEDLILNSEQKL